MIKKSILSDSAANLVELINIVISLLSDIKINKHDKKLTSVLFLDIKSAYDHLNKSQIIKIYKNAKLSSVYIN